MNKTQSEPGRRELYGKDSVYSIVRRPHHHQLQLYDSQEKARKTEHSKDGFKTMSFLSKLFKRRSKQSVARGIGGEKEPKKQKEIRCPSCGHRFAKPSIIIATQAVIDKYGPNLVRCPKCQHIYSGIKDPIVFDLSDVL